MKWFDRWKKTELDVELRGFELKLEDALTSVDPHPEFVIRLRKNLLKQNLEISLIPEPQNQKLQTGLLVTGGILSVILMVLAGVRGVVSVFGIIGLLISFIKQNSQEASTQVNIAN